MNAVVVTGVLGPRRSLKVGADPTLGVVVFPVSLLVVPQAPLDTIQALSLDEIWTNLRDITDIRLQNKEKGLF